jgi:MFS family permease
LRSASSAAARAVFAFASFLYVPFLAPYIKETLQHANLHGISLNIWLGIIAAAAPLAVILCVHAMGALSDDIGRKRIILIGMLFSLSSIIIYLLAKDPLLFVLARGMEVVGYTTVTMLTLVSVNDLLEGKARGRVQGIFMSIQQAGNILGPLAGAWLAVRYFPQLPFLAAILIFAALALLLLTQPAAQAKPASAKSLSLFQNWRRFLGFRKLKGIAITGMVMNVLSPATVFFLPLFILERFPGKYLYIGYAAFMLAAFKPLQFVVGEMVDQYGKAKLTVLGCIIAGTGVFIIPFTHTLPMLLAAAFLISVGTACYNVGAWTVMSDIGEANHIEGSIIGSSASIGKLGDLVAALLFGVIAAYYGFEAIFFIAGYIILAGVVIGMIYLRDIAERMPETKE